MTKFYINPFDNSNIETQINIDKDNFILYGFFYRQNSFKVYEKHYYKTYLHKEDGPAIIYVEEINGKIITSTCHYLHGNIIGANFSNETFEKLKNIYYKKLTFK